MVMNISCKFEKASYTIFLVRAITVKSLHTAAAVADGDAIRWILELLSLTISVD